MRAGRAAATFPLMGTLATIVVPGAGHEDALKAARRALRSLEARLTVNGAAEDSQVEAINRAAGAGTVRVDPDVYRLVRTSVRASRMHRGGFNALIGPLVKAWGIGFEGARVPSADEIERLLPLADPEAVVLDDGARSVGLLRAGMRLDLGAIAKGYAADRAAEVLREHGVSRGLIDLGGNVLAMGGAESSEDGTWRVGVQSPFRPRGTPIAVLRLRDVAAVTSGVYERFLEAGGRRFHHLLDPLTGVPFETGLASATAVCASATDAEVWSTVAQRGGIRDGLRILEDAPGVEGVLVALDGTVVATRGARAALEVIVPSARSAVAA